MSLELETEFSHYQVVSRLGSGGMGEVYLAEDNRLNRKVALKILPAELVSNPDRRRRFTQEARAASALNHPNIITIYEIGEFNSISYIAMEYVTGKTLSEAPISDDLKQILTIFTQIAEALATAHEAGIIHRDLKPDNVMVRTDGYIKILDFGLAKLIESGPLNAGSDVVTQLKNATAPGTVMGTIAYMSPEQARGRELDARSDIFSFGSMLYETLTNRLPFTGETMLDTLYAIAHQEPQPFNEANSVPTRLQDIVYKALAKDPAERYQTMKDLAVDLRRVKRDTDTFKNATVTSETPETAAAKPTIRAKTRADATTQSVIIARPGAGSVLMKLGLLLLLLALFGVGYGLGRRGTNLPVATKMAAFKSTQITASPGLDCFPSFSPDGNSIAYSSDRSGRFEIYVKQLTLGGREIQITSDGGQNLQPAWSPDGGYLAYYSRARGGINIIPALGGIPKQITDFGSGPTWTPDGKSLYFQSDIVFDLSATAFPAIPPSTIWSISLNGGEAKQVTRPETPVGGHGSPYISPDGKHLVFLAYDLGASAIWSLNLESGELHQIAVSTITPYYFNPIYSPDGRDLFYTIAAGSANFALCRQPLNERGLPEGAPIELLNTVFNRIKHLAISRDGKKIAFNVLTMTSNLYAISLSPTTGKAEGQPRLMTNNTAFRNFNPAFSADGKQLAWTSWYAGALPDIWAIDSDGKNPRQLTTDPAFDSLPSWSADGEQIFFVSNRPADVSIWSLSTKTGKEQLIFGPQEDMRQVKFSPDGRQFVCQYRKNSSTNLWLGELPNGNFKQLTFDKEMMGFPCWSPDGKFIAFEIKRGNNDYIGVIPSAGGEPIQLNIDPGHSWANSWSPDNDKIAFSGFRNGYWNIWWISRSTREQQQLTTFTKPNSYVRYPEWSPKGDQLVYEYSETIGNIWIMERTDLKQ